MVDRADLERVTDLCQESRVISEALANFANGGVIIDMTISGGPLSWPSGEPPAMRMPVSLPTIGIGYPAAMVDAITVALRARQQAINNELTSLGVT
jgi:hypothetical protein